MTVFCDWITISQTHDYAPIVGATDVTAICRETGEIEWHKTVGIREQGSYDTSVYVSCDGHKVQVSGNVSRYGCADNVFGLSVAATIRKTNRLLATLDLPPMTPGQWALLPRRNAAGDVVESTVRTGARISALHLTQNYIAGSPTDAQDFLYWLSCQRLTRQDLSHYGSKTIYHGERSKFRRLKIYDKAAEMSAHRKRLRPTPYQQQVKQWVQEIGLIRFEIELKSRYLTQHEIYHPDWWTDENMKNEYAKNAAPLQTRCEEYTAVSDLPNRARDMYYAYCAGENLRDRKGMSRATFYRYRRLILAAGVDIAEPLNVRALHVKPKIITLRPADMPDFYQPEAI